MRSAAEPPRVKPAPDRLYGRRRGQALRPRQRALLDQALPRLALADPGRPQADFARLWVEVGAGGGEHARAIVAAQPETLLIASEVYENGLASLLSALVPEPLDPATAPLPPNLRLWPADGRDLLRRLPPGSVDTLVLMFPDPWPKERHAKRRFVHPAILPLVAGVLRPGGAWRIGTDDPTYQDWVGRVLAGQTLFDTALVADARPAGWPATRYEAKAVAAGRAPRWWLLHRR